MNQDKIKKKLLEEQCDWFTFKMNVPAASHMGGVWERQIRTVRNVLASLLQDNGQQLDDESLRTLMCEAEAIVNSRPLTVTQLTDPDSASEGVLYKIIKGVSVELVNQLRQLMKVFVVSTMDLWQLAMLW